MKSMRISRRGFLKLSLFGTSAVAASATLVSVAASAPLEAQAAAQQPQLLALPQPTFNLIASTTAFGAPIDIAAGWDGTLWAIDASGAPHLYDSTQNAWLAHGDPLSGACWLGTTYYWFKGTEVVTAPFGGSISAPQTLAAAFPKIPDSFKLSIVGAANVSGVLMLFNGGRYAPADGSAAPVNLTALANWPQTALWADGVIDAVHSDGTGSVVLFCGAEFITANLQAKTVTSEPALLSSYALWQNRLPADWATTGIDAGFTLNGNAVLYKGTGVINFSVPGSGMAVPAYIGAVNPTWPATWHPVLNHAPAGRMGNLWAATQSGGVVQHDGEVWSIKDNTGNGVTNVAVGQDNSAFLCGINSKTLWQWNGATWAPIATSGIALSQVAVGDSGHVFVRGTDNSVQQLGTGNALAAVSLGAGVPLPTHMAANADGTLWHCNSSDPDTYRFISEATPVPSAQIPVKGAGLVAGVKKVASTGYGAAHCLVQHNDGSTNVYRYDSPFIFKSPDPVQPQGPLVAGLGQLYFAQYGLSSSGIEATSNIFAVDAQTGRVAAVSPTITSPTLLALQHTPPVFDPLNELLYVGVYPSNNSFDQTTPGQVLALDARTLQVRWRYETKTGVDATPALSGTQLFFGDRLAQVYRFDTRKALQDVSELNEPQPSWIVPTGFAGGQTERVATPVVNGSKLYAVVWDVIAQYNGKQTNVVGLFSCDAVTGQNSSISVIGDDSDVDVNSIIFQPLITMTAGEGGATLPVLWFSMFHKILGLSLDNAVLPLIYVFNMSPGSGITSPLTYDDGTRLNAGLNGPSATTKLPGLWFGDSQGNLWGVDINGENIGPLGLLQTLPHTPYFVQAADPNAHITITTAPVLYKDSQGGMTVLFGAPDPSPAVQPNGYLYGFDPDNGNGSSLITGTTQITSLSRAAVNGVVYAGGQPVSTDAPPSQLFAIRVDELIQELRDFVIEGELLQDPDENAKNGDPANNVPPSVARYHTHLTVVDDQKNPQVHETVKIWADSPATMITVDGQPFTIGPDDVSYALVKTGADGALVLTMDAVDYFAPTLRVWAGFMDPYERIVVNADTAFHQRVTTAYTDPNAAPSQDDPDRINLSNCRNYSGKALFTDDEKSADPPAPKNVADSIQQASTGLGLNQSSSKALYRKLMRSMGVKHKNQRVQVTILENAAAPPEKYMAYADLPAAAHFPANIPANRPATIAQSIGLSFSRPGGDTTQAPVFTALSHTDARAAIDALEGEAWKPTDPTGAGSPNFKPAMVFNIFSDFWNWLKKLFDKIAQCILSIAEDILAGIQYVVDGILKVFKAILKVLADIFPFLGSFFKMLEKAIDDVIAALSVLFEFGEIVKTHKWLEGQFGTHAGNLKTVISTTIKTNVDAFFEKGEDAIKGFFDTIRKQLSPSQNISNLKGMGATAHTAFNIGPRGGTKTSHATQCSYGIQKLKSGVSSASSGASAKNNAQPAETQADPVTDFVTAFLARLRNDSDLGPVFSQLKSDFSNLFSAGSAKQFFTTLVETLLDILEVLLVGALAISNALFDGVLAIIEDVIDAVMDVLDTEIDIPVLSWLYETLFGEPLTFLNVLMLVAAIPVTIIYRIVEGEFPSAAFARAARQGTLRAEVNATVANILGICNGIVSIVLGVVSGISDAVDPEGETPSILVKLSFGLGFVSLAFGFPLISNDTPSGWDWGVYGIGVLTVLVAPAFSQAFSEQGDPDIPVIMPFITALINLILLAITITAFVEDGQTDAGSDVGFAAGIISTLPGLVNPLKKLGEPAVLVVSGVDVVAGFAVGVLDIVGAVLVNAPALVYRIHIPHVMTGPSSPWPYAVPKASLSLP